jgi:uncharacterized protein YndB with AHSA1/START domain
LPEPQSETSIVEHEIRIAADPETVFPFFTDPEKIVHWMGIRATLDPRPGGVFSLNTMTDFFVEGKFVAVEPPHRVVFTWGYRESADEQPNPFPPGSSTVEVNLVPDGETTIVRLTHRLPAYLAHFHAMGWENYLGRLAIVAAGGDPGPDPFLEFGESMTAGTD